jgi:hypothetical protein
VSAPKVTTFLFLAGTALFDVLATAEFGLCEGLTVPPLVQFGALLPADHAPREMVSVVGNPETNDEYATLGVVGRDEQFVLTVSVHVMNTGLAGDAVWLRMGEIVNVIGGTLRSATTGRPEIPASIAMVGTIGVHNWDIVGKRVAIIPAGEGVDGFAEIDIRVQARI